MADCLCHSVRSAPCHCAVIADGVHAVSTIHYGTLLGARVFGRLPTRRVSVD